MAVVAHLVERTVDPGDGLVDGIVAVLLAIDNAVDTSAALIKARAVTVANAHGIALPVGYFDTNRLVSTTWDAAGDCSFFKGMKAHETIAA